MKENKEDQKEHPPTQTSSGSSQHSRPGRQPHAAQRQREVAGQVAIRSQSRQPHSQARVSVRKWRRTSPNPGGPGSPCGGGFTAGFWSPQTGVHLRAPCSCPVSVESGRRAVHPCAGEAVTEPRKPAARTPGASLAALGLKVLLTALAGCPSAVLREGPPQAPSEADGPWAPPTPATLPAVCVHVPMSPVTRTPPILDEDL